MRFQEFTLMVSLRLSLLEAPQIRLIFSGSLAAKSCAFLKIEKSVDGLDAANKHDFQVKPCYVWADQAPPDASSRA